MSVSLSTFLISQVGWVISDMGAPAVGHLQTLLPLLRNILIDPFATTTPKLLLESLKALQETIQVCWPRIKEKWWEECLRGIVTCWLNVCDDEAELLPSAVGSERSLKLAEVEEQLKTVARLLEDVVGAEYLEAVRDLIEEAPELERLFTFFPPPNVSQSQAKSLINEMES